MSKLFFRSYSLWTLQQSAQLLGYSTVTFRTLEAIQWSRSQIQFNKSILFHLIILKSILLVLFYQCLSLQSVLFSFNFQLSNLNAS